MLDLFLRASTRADMWAAYHAAGLTVEISAAEAEGRPTHAVETAPLIEGGDPVVKHYVPRLASHGWALDDGVPIVVTPAVVDPDTLETITPAVLSDQWHTNIRIMQGAAAIRDALLDAGVEIITPNTPQRVFG